MQRFHSAIIVGSLRQRSFSSFVASALIDLSPACLDFSVVPIADLPLYNQDYDAASPPAYEAFRAAIRKADAVLFVTPEYNRSVPAPLKNAIDVGSRPWGQSVFDRKPAAVVSQSPGTMGGFGANHAIRQSLAFLNMPTLAQPEMYLANVAALFDESGTLIGESAHGFFVSFLEAYVAWIARHVG